MAADGPLGYIDKYARPVVGYVVQGEALLVKAKKVVREEGIIAGSMSKKIPFDLHLYWVNGNESFQQHLGASPISNFTSSVGGHFGYLPNDATASRAWLVLGDRARDSKTMCAEGHDLDQQLLLDDLKELWAFSGTVGIVGGKQTPVRWIIDTGGASRHIQVPLSVLAALVEGIEKDGHSQVITSKTDGSLRISNCKNASKRFPSIEFSLGDRIHVKASPGAGFSYIDDHDQDGSCGLMVRVNQDKEISLSTKIIDKHYFLFDSKGKKVGICPKNRSTIASLS